MRRPAVGLGVAFASGVGIGFGLPALPGILPTVLGVCACLWLIMLLLHGRGWDRLVAVGIFVLMGLLGYVMAIRPVAGRGLDDALGITVSRWPGCTVSGIVNRDVAEMSGSGATNRTPFGLQVDTVVRDGVTNRVQEMLTVTLYGTPNPPPVYGERWTLTGTLNRHVWKGRVQWRFRGGLRQSQRHPPAGLNLPAFAQQVRRGASSILAHGVDGMDDVTGVVQALLLGYRAQLDPEINRSFINTGTMHIFSISGLHVAILCSVLVFAIGLCGVPRTCWVFALAPMIMLYAMTTGCRASAIRSGVMASAYLLAPALRRRPDVVSAMALAAIGILVWQPAQLFDIGCILSFSAVAGILAIVPVLDAILLYWLRPDPLAVAGLTDGTRWWHPVALWVGRLATVSIAAWLTSVPLSLFYFGRLSLIALIANLIVVPMSFLITVTGCLSLVAGAGVGLWLAGIFNCANAVFVRLVIDAMRLLEAVPCGHYENSSISLDGMVLWYVLLIYATLLLRDVADRLADTQFGKGMRVAGGHPDAAGETLR